MVPLGICEIFPLENNLLYGTSCCFSNNLPVEVNIMYHWVVAYQLHLLYISIPVRGKIKEAARVYMVVKPQRAGV